MLVPWTAKTPDQLKAIFEESRQRHKDKDLSGQDWDTVLILLNEVNQYRKIPCAPLGCSNCECG